jgi:nucleotide-binding universal stress UspA family protein
MGLSYFVPVDLSEHSYKPVQYALLLARESGGSVTLGHVIDIDQVTESDNQAVVRWSMDRLENAALAKMASLVEMVSLSGIAAKHEIMFGFEKRETLKMIRRVNPDMVVVLRRQREGSDLASFLVRNCSQSVLVVPEACEPQVPSRTLLAADRPPSVRDTILKMVWQSSREVSILDLRRRWLPAASVAGEWADHVREEYGLRPQMLSRKLDTPEDIKEFVSSQPVDLLCTVRGTRSFFLASHHERVSAELIRGLQIPVMVVSRN